MVCIKLCTLPRALTVSTTALLPQQSFFYIGFQHVHFHLFSGVGVDVAITAQYRAASEGGNYTFNFQMVDTAQLLSCAFNEPAALIRDRETRFCRREYPGAAHQNQIAKQVRAHVCRPASLLFPMESRDGVGDFGFQRSLCWSAHRVSSKTGIQNEQKASIAAESCRNGRPVRMLAYISAELRLQPLAFVNQNYFIMLPQASRFLQAKFQQNGKLSGSAYFFVLPAFFVVPPDFMVLSILPLPGVMLSRIICLSMRVSVTEPERSSFIW